MDAVTSREYKLILASDRFADRKAGSDALRDLIVYVAERLGAKVKTQSSEDRRQTSYLDTEDFRLRASGYALRVRHEDDRSDTKITLKIRSPDLVLAEAASVGSAEPDRADEKFEEDLLPPFRSIFSRSNALRFQEVPNLGTVGDALEIFPGLKDLKLAKKTPLRTVNGFTAQEVFRKLCKIDFGTGGEVRLGLSFWYAGKTRDWPLIAECAFDYQRGRKEDRFDTELVRRANSFFATLQKQPGWFNAQATTKTSYAYEGLTR